MYSIRKSEVGFTLVELLVYLALSVIAMTGIYSLFVSNSRSYSSQENTVTMNQDLRAAMNLAVWEIRMAGYDPTGAAAAGFLSDADDKYNTDGNSIHFTMDLDGNGDTAGPNEDVNYHLYTSDGIQKLGRRTGGGIVQPVAENITGLTFTYFDANGNVTAVLADIRTAQMTITAQTPNVDPILGQKKTETMTTRVRVRNAGLGP